MEGSKRRIVVGVDGSGGSRAVLRWALGYAEWCGGRVVAVFACEVPALIDVALMMPEEERVLTVGERELRKAVDETCAELDTGIPVERRVVRQDAVRALLDEARDSDLLVVGRRGHGMFAQVLLGSVSRHCVNHAPCPVVVVSGPG